MVRLGHVVLGDLVEEIGLGIGGVDGRQDDDRQVGEILHLARERQPVHAGHQHVDDEQVRPALPKPAQRLVAVAGGDDVVAVGSRCSARTTSRLGSSSTMRSAAVTQRVIPWVRRAWTEDNSGPGRSRGRWAPRVARSGHEERVDRGLLDRTAVACRLRRGGARTGRARTPRGSGSPVPARRRVVARRPAGTEASTARSASPSGSDPLEVSASWKSRMTSTGASWPPPLTPRAAR